MVTGGKIERPAGVGAGPAYARPPAPAPGCGLRGAGIVSAACLNCDIYPRKLGLKMKVILMPRPTRRRRRLMHLSYA